MAGATKKGLPKRKRGRPATGRDPVVALRIPEELIAAIDKRAKREGKSRADAMRELLVRGFNAEAEHAEDILTLLGVDVSRLTKEEIREGVEAARRISQCERVPGSNKRRPAAVAAWQAFVAKHGLAKD